VNFSQTLHRAANDFPLQAALIEVTGRASGHSATPAHRRITYAELNALADRYACGFRRVGVRRGDRALFLLKPGIEFYGAIYGLLRVGAVVVLIDPGMGLRGLLRCVSDIRPRVVVAVSAVHAVGVLASAALRRAEIRITDGSRWFWGGPTLSACRDAAERSSRSDAPQQPRDVCYADSDEAVIAFTSGSTGPAKPVLFTHGMLHAQAAAIGHDFGWEPATTMVMCFPGFVPPVLANGLTAVLPQIDFARPAAVPPERMLEAIIGLHAQCAFASPSIWENLTRYCERHKIQLATLQDALTTGAPVSLGMHSRFRRVCPGGELHTPYGATEAMPLTTISTSQLLSHGRAGTLAGKGTCIGRPLSGVDLRIIRIVEQPIATWTDQLLVAPGEIGEIVVGGPVVSSRYVDRPQANAETKIRDNGRVLHRTGDMGLRDEDGRIWFCGRVAHRVVSDAGMLPPVAVEGPLNEHPLVFRTALVGVCHDGAPASTPVVCVQMEQGTTLSPQIVRELVQRLAGTPWQGRVTRFVQHPGFPTDLRHNSKIRREILAQWAQSKFAANHLHEV
jgi:acyl-CoA synthetase (AMP-forming)/AMP-acid ligase II